MFLVAVSFVDIAYAHHDGAVHTAPFNYNVNYTEAIEEWEQARYGTKNCTGFVKVIVTDPDMNKISSYQDTVYAFVFSDSHREGITLKLYETEKTQEYLRESLA